MAIEGPTSILHRIGDTALLPLQRIVPGNGAQILLKLESETGRYRMTLVEHLRTAYWRENLWPRLTQVTQRP